MSDDVFTACFFVFLIALMAATAVVCAYFNAIGGLVVMGSGAVFVALIGISALRSNAASADDVGSRA